MVNALVQATADAWREWSFDPSFPFSADHCVNGARVVVETLRRFGLNAKPVSVTVALLNRTAHDLASAGVAIDEWPEWAWSVGVNPNEPTKPGRWNGHLMVEGDNWTLDVSARQFARPGLLIVDGPWVLPKLPVDERLVLVDEHDQRLIVERSPANNGWRHAPGWKRLHGDEIDELARRVIGAMPS